MSTLLGRSGVLKAAVALCVILTPALAAERGACTFTAPADWNQSTTRWDGECRDGRADGLGILKEYDKQKVVRFFFGRVKGGDITLGVIESPEGFTAGRFAKGQLVPSDDRQVYLDAFAEAEKAAIEAAKRFEKAGNKGSAKYYQDKAQLLGGQLD